MTKVVYANNLDQLNFDERNMVHNCLLQALEEHGGYGEDVFGRVVLHDNFALWQEDREDQDILEDYLDEFE